MNSNPWAVVQRLIDKALAGYCPLLVGMGFFTSDAAFDPSRQWPGTQWQKIEGRFILAASDKHPLSETGGEEAHTIEAGEIPTKESALLDVDAGTDSTAYLADRTVALAAGRAIKGKRYWWSSTVVPYKETVSAHNNMPPYIVRVYWERVA